MNPNFYFKVGVETNDQTGDVIAVYLQIRKGKVAKVKEYADGNVFADYDRNGNLLGFEVLAPCTAAILNRIAGDAPIRRFVKRSLPPAMVAA